MVVVVMKQDKIDKSHTIDDHDNDKKITAKI